jgi:carbamate kinase
VSDPGARPIVIVAMGGHAFMQKGERGSIEEHERNAARIAGLLMTLVDSGYHLVITHGNGPQVGNLLLQNECAREQVSPMPLDVLVGMTEGSLGYILQQALLNQLRRREVRRYVVTMVPRSPTRASRSARSCLGRRPSAAGRSSTGRFGRTRDAAGGAWSRPPGPSRSSRDT